MKQRFPDIKIHSLGLVIQPKVPWLGYSADGVNIADKCLIEVKCPASGKKQTCSEVIKHLSYIDKNTFTLKRNHAYFSQIQLGMGLLRLNMCHFLIYCTFDDTNALLVIPFDHSFFKDLLSQLKNIYFNRILPELSKRSTGAA